MKVYVILKNSDFTEGRGPMVLHKIKKTEKSAVDYVMSREGIFGSTQKESHYSQLNSNVRYFNGYDILTMEVEE